MIRTFIAVEISSNVRRRAADLLDLMRPVAPGVSWVKPENMHLTLKFLGDRKEDEIPKICDAVAATVRRHGPFSLVLGGVGAFPRISRPSAIWLGGGEGVVQIKALAEDLDNAMKRLGYPRERRPFQPHLTLGRVRRSGPAAAALVEMLRRHVEFHAGESAVDEVVVFSSQLHPKGSIYTPLCRAKLEGPGG